MISKFKTSLRVGAVAALGLCVTIALCAEPSGDAASNSTKQEAAAATASSEGESAVSIAAARDRAQLMHKIYTATLDTMHRHYFHSNRSVLPARAMEDVFTEMSEQSNIESRWISVNTPAMSLHHEPRTEFEKQAAAAIAAGKEEFERVEKGFYRRAGAIALADGCVACHTGFSAKPPTSPRFAGLVISMPIVEK